MKTNKTTIFAGIVFVASLVLLGYNVMNYQKESKAADKAQNEYFALIKDQQKKQNELDKINADLKDKAAEESKAQNDLKLAKEGYEKVANNKESYTAKYKEEIDFFITKTAVEQADFKKDYEAKQEASDKEPDVKSSFREEIMKNALNTKQGSNGLPKEEAVKKANEIGMYLNEGNNPGYLVIAQMITSFIKEGRPFADGQWIGGFPKDGDYVAKGTVEYDRTLGTNFSGKNPDGKYADAN